MQIDPSKTFATKIEDEELIKGFEKLVESRRKKLGIDWSDLDTLLAQYIQAHIDPIYFIENFIRLDTPEGLKTVKLYEKQKLIILSALKFHHIIVLGSRQTGKTTSLHMLNLWLAKTLRKYSIVFTQQKAQYGMQSLERIKDMYRNLPRWFRYDRLKVDNRTKMQLFETDSMVIFTAINPANPDAAGRSLSADSLLIDEAAFIPGIKQAYTALKPVLARRTAFLKQAGIPYYEAIVSTPNGIVGRGEWFYNQWVNALRGKSKFVPIYFHWSEVPELRDDPEWYKEATSGMDEREILQEYELVFVPPEDAFVDFKTASELQKYIAKPIKTEALQFGELRVYKEFNPQHYYIIGVDVADSGSDEAAIVVLDFNTDEVAAVYNNKSVLSLDFLRDVIEVFIRYPKSIIAIERNGIGAPLVEILMQIIGLDVRIYVDPEHRRKKLRQKMKYAGIRTTASTRPKIINALKMQISNHPDKIRDYQLVLDLLGLVRKGNKVEAAGSAKDDLPMALGFAAYVKYFGEPGDYFAYLDRTPDSNWIQERINSLLKNFNGTPTEETQQTNLNNIKSLLTPIKASGSNRSIARGLRNKKNPYPFNNFAQFNPFNFG